MEQNKDIAYIDNLHTYMKEVDRTALLTTEEEQKLLQQIEKSKRSDCSYYFRKKGEAARQIMIKSNLKLVIKIAKEFRNIGLDYEDIINEGNLGLMNAVEKYDLSKGAKFSYYASFWIKQSIRRAISNKGRTIRLPVGVVETKLKINRYIEEEEKASGKRPKPIQISRALDLPIVKVNNVLGVQLQSESLNEKINEENGELQHVIPDKKSISPYQKCEIKDNDEVLGGFINKLDERQRYIIIRRFGLDGDKPETLEVIGKKFDLTRERIRQLELAALRSLKEMYREINKNSLIE